LHFRHIFPRLKKFGDLFLSKATLARRALLKTEESEQKANDAERLDRLRNPSDYRGR
jgi:hypothetical protein